MSREQDQFLTNNESTQSVNHSEARESVKKGTTSYFEWKYSETCETVRTLVFSLLFLIVGFSIFLYFLNYLGLLHKSEIIYRRVLTKIPCETSLEATPPAAQGSAVWTSSKTNLSTTVPIIPRNCALGYRKFSGTGFCYKKFLHEATFREAQEVCAKKNNKGNLVSIHSDAENEFLAEMIKSNRTIRNKQDLQTLDGEFWIGLHYDNGWQWTDRTAVDYNGSERWLRESHDNNNKYTAMVSSKSEDANPKGDKWMAFDSFTKQKGFICKRLPNRN